MKVIAVDDKKIPLEALAEAIRDAEPRADITTFRNPLEAASWEGVSQADVAFVDIDMPGMNGVQLARELKMANPRINIIFATGFSEYTGDAMKLHASGYLTKPITAEKVRRELDDLRHPVEIAKTKRLFVRCFGDFEAFVDGSPLSFDRTKTKELLAFLVDRRGAVVSMRAIEAVLWEDAASTKGLQSYLRTLSADLRRTLETAGLEDVLVKRRGALGVNPSVFDCDYYDFINGDPQAVRSYHGEYMSQYSWAEITLANLMMRQ